MSDIQDKKMSRCSKAIELLITWQDAEEVRCKTAIPGDIDKIARDAFAAYKAHVYSCSDCRRYLLDLRVSSSNDTKRMVIRD